MLRKLICGISLGLSLLLLNSWAPLHFPFYLGCSLGTWNLGPSFWQWENYNNMAFLDVHRLTYPDDLIVLTVLFKGSLLCPPLKLFELSKG